jgi:hypothetical protein
MWRADLSQHNSRVDALDRRRTTLEERDLASGYQLAWLPVPDETAETVFAAQTALFGEYGAPLVIKSDNGFTFPVR